MKELAESLLAELDRLGSNEAQPTSINPRLEELSSATPELLAGLFDELAQRAPFPKKRQQDLLAAVLDRAARQFHPRHQPAKNGEPIPSALRNALQELYRQLGPTSPARAHLLAMLSGSAVAEDLALLAELIAEDPPGDADATVIALAPLWQQRGWNPSPLFPRLLDALMHRSCMGVVLDLMNYLTRSELVGSHPAAGSAQRLADLLGNMAQQLGKLEETQVEDARQAAEKVAEGVAMAVSLCDALALIGDKSVVGKLYQALDLGHRRLRTEAAAALARLGEEPGREALVELAKEPVARLRVLAYAEELGFLDKVEDQYKTLEARAESELSLSLAQPSLFGFPPSLCELIDSREQYWPGYDNPVHCFLFRFEYILGEHRFSNIGIAGPVAHALTADLADLAPDDIYAVYAGWQAEHEDIVELDAGQLDEFQQTDVSRMERRLHDAKYESIVPRIFGTFFGEKVLVAEARKDGVSGHAVIDGSDIFWYPQKPTPRPLSPSQLYCIYKGKKLLRSFNP